MLFDLVKTSDQSHHQSNSTINPGGLDRDFIQFIPASFIVMYEHKIPVTHQSSTLPAITVGSTCIITLMAHWKGPQKGESKKTTAKFSSKVKCHSLNISDLISAYI